MKKIKIKTDNIEFEAFYFKNIFELSKGLMFYRNGNALFEFKKEGNYKIWTLFMRFPIDLIFLKNMKIINIIKNVKPISLNPCTWKIYSNKEKYNYLLELDSRKKISEKLEIAQILKIKNYE
ncbi:MAG: hypothetical protein B6U88_01190 [Candidatus Aenigmarchaeota archaeon ex4484_56]|nr:MAG: hypothetical protein B6U88_01190 [Candidatus Aenigmarchaeota archaeon ex4484_56]